MNAAQPIKDEGASARDASPLKQDLQPRNCAGSACGVKRFATLRAHLALKGYSLHRTAADDGPVCFYVTRCGLVRELRDFAAARDFAEQLGVQL